MRRVALISIAAVLTGLIAGQVLSGCGSDDSSSQDVTTPELTVPGDSSIGTTDRGTTDRGTTDEGTTGDTGSSTGTGGSPPAQQAPTAPSGGAQAAPEDTPQNDTAPAAGSPAQRYERFCDQNPGAC
jgi:hypothetical protein